MVWAQMWLQSNHHLKVLDRVVRNLKKKPLPGVHKGVWRPREGGNNRTLRMSTWEIQWLCVGSSFFKNEDPSTTKICPVFNCTLKSGNSVSLNEAAYPRVNLLFTTVLLADIRKALLMIHLASNSDKSKFCFFLKNNNCLKCYRYITIIFGFNASLFILNCILKYLAGQLHQNTAIQLLCG